MENVSLKSISLMVAVLILACLFVASALDAFTNSQWSSGLFATFIAVVLFWTFSGMVYEFIYSE